MSTAAADTLEVTVIPVTPFAQNCSIVVCTKTREAVVIDAGGDVARLMQHIHANKLKVTALWLTHGHVDHASGAPALAQALQDEDPQSQAIPIIGPHAADQYWLDDLPERARAYGFSNAPYAAVSAFTPTRYLNDGDTLTVGTQTIHVLHCPGHTPGHVVFYHPATAMAWVGDVLFQGSIGRTDFPGGNHAQLLNSIHSQLLPLGEHIEFVPGHGPNSTFGRERLTNPYLVTP